MLRVELEVVVLMEHEFAKRAALEVGVNPA
jgi:hypothetical protein